MYELADQTHGFFLGLVSSMTPCVSPYLRPAASVAAFLPHLMGLYQGQSGAKYWRRRLSDIAVQKPVDVIGFIKDSVVLAD